MNPAMRLMAAGRFGGAAPPTKVQSAFAAASTLTLASAPTNGNMLVVATGGSTNPSTFASLTTLGYTMRVSKSNAGAWWTSIWSKTASGDSATITVTEGCGTRPHVSCFEFSRAFTFDKSATFDASYGLTYTIGPTATLASSPGVAVVVVQYGNGTTTSSPVGFTMDHSDSDGIAGHSILSSTAGKSVTATESNGRNTAACLACFT